MTASRSPFVSQSRKRRPDGNAAEPAMARDLMLARIARLTTERDAARQALARAQDERMALIVNLSHELRTPLNAIVGYSDLIRSGVLGAVQPMAYRGYVDAMHDAGLHLVELVDAVLDMARIGARAMPLDESLVSPAAQLHETARLLMAFAQQRRVRLKVRAARDLPRLWADERMVRQILLNLVSNAIKFSPEGGSVHLSARLLIAGQLCLDVRDEGPGLDPQEAEAAMRPFQQLEAAQSLRWRGTGLGLPLARSLAELHDADLQLGRGRNGGTLARIRFPASRVRKAGSAGPDQPEFTFSRPTALS